MFAYGAKNQCEKFYTLHWCRGTAGINAFAFNLGGESAWGSCSSILIGRVWRKLRSDAAVATLLVPLWESATWWTLLVPDAIHFVEAVVDWVWLPKMEPTFLCRGSARPEGTLPRPTCQLWQSGSIYRPEQQSAGFPSAIDAFAEVVMPAGASSGTASEAGGPRNEPAWTSTGVTRWGWR